MATEQRTRRVAEQIKKEVSQILLEEVKDPRLGFVTITTVEVSADLRHVKIFFSYYGSEEGKKQSREALESSSGFVRREIGRRIKLRYTPEITFKFDASLEHADKISRLLTQLEGPETKE